MELKKLLHEYNISQEQLAAFMGIPRGRISMWIKNNKDYPPKNPDAGIYDIAANMGTSVQMIEQYYGRQATTMALAANLGS